MTTRGPYNTASKRDPHGFTPTERLFADMLLAGLYAREMAEATGSTINCVRSHLHRVYRKLGVDCAAYAIDVLRGRHQLRELSEPFADELDRAAHESDPRTLEYGGYET